MSAPSPEPASRVPYWRPLADLALVVGAIAAVGGFLLQPSPPAKRPPIADIAPTPPDEAVSIARTPLPAPTQRPPRPVAPQAGPDEAAIAKANAALDAVSRDRGRAEARAADAALRLEAAEAKAAHLALSVRNLPATTRNPSRQLASAKARGEVLRATRDHLAGELQALASVPRPRPKPLVDKSPVARPTDGDEFHFELHHNRVSYIDLDRLIDRVKSDARVQIRLANGDRNIESEVGPIGHFSLRYEMSRGLPGSLQDMLGGQSASYDLAGWEVVPTRPIHGESFEEAQHPASDFSRAVHRLNPSESTVTFWVYPDSFALYRRLRDELHSHGFVVAARPLPEGLAIRGSPHGSVSAGQ